MVSLSLVELVILILVAMVWAIISEQQKIAAMSPEEQANYKQKAARKYREASAQSTYGPISPQLICPHCQWKRTVRTRGIKRKAGISGGKATAAILTGGVSMLATGLSRKEALTQAHCDNCNSTWSF